MYRKSAQLTQEDVAYISALGDYANISRMETGLKEPNLEVLLVYHFLFDMPVDELIKGITSSTKQTVIDRIALRIQELKALTPDTKINHRIAFLESALARLITSENL